MRTKSASEILIRRQLSTLKELVREYKMTADVMLVTSTVNMADRLTRVPHQWFNVMKKENGYGLVIGAVHMDDLDTSQIMSIHRNSGDPGVWHTTYFVKRLCQATTKAVVKSAI